MYNQYVYKAPDSQSKEANNCSLFAPKAIRPSSLARTSNI